jgi:hypothetical protein
VFGQESAQMALLNFAVQAHHGAEIVVGIETEADAMFGVFVTFET